MRRTALRAQAAVFVRGLGAMRQGRVPAIPQRLVEPALPVLVPPCAAVQRGEVETGDRGRVPRMHTSGQSPQDVVLVRGHGGADEFPPPLTGLSIVVSAGIRVAVAVPVSGSVLEFLWRFFLRGHDLIPVHDGLDSQPAEFAGFTPTYVGNIVARPA